MGSTDKGQGWGSVRATPDSVPFLDFRAQMNFYLTKNTSRARWQLKKLSVNLKQVCVPLIIAGDEKLVENFPPHILFNSWFSILVLYPIYFDSWVGEVGWWVVFLSVFFVLTCQWPGTSLNVF